MFCNVLQFPSLHEHMLYFFLLVKVVRCDLQKWLEAGKGSIIHQQINGANVLQGGLCGPPVCQVYTHRGDGCTLGEGAKTRHVSADHRRSLNTISLYESFDRPTLLIHSTVSKTFKLTHLQLMD